MNPPAPSRPADDAPRPPARHINGTHLIDIVFPDQANHHGTLFGGAAVALMDKAAFIVATRHGRRSMVTAASDRIDFHAPARQGQLVDLCGRILRVGSRSMDVEVDLVAEDLLSDRRTLCTRGRFVMVAVDGQGPLPPLGSAPEAAGETGETRMAELVFPGDTNHHQTLFGGRALALMEKAAFVSATRHCRRTVVLAALDRIDFHAPVREGEMVETVGRVARTGRTSIHIEVGLYAESLLDGERRLCTRGHFVMVALDAAGRPTPVPGLRQGRRDPDLANRGAEREKNII